MSNPFDTDKPADPRGGFDLSPEGCINGTAWGGEITLDESPIESPYTPYQEGVARQPVTSTPY